MRARWQSFLLRWAVLIVAASISSSADLLADLRDLEKGDALVKAPLEDEVAWHALGDAGTTAPKRKAKAALVLAGNAKAEQFPFLTLKKLGAQVSAATISDDSYLEKQQETCKANLLQFKQVEKKSQALLDKAKTIRDQSHEQATLKRGFWATSRDEERKSSRELKPMLKERSKQYDAFQQRTNDNIQSMHILLRAGKMICTRLRKITGTHACSKIYEEPVASEPKKSFLSDKVQMERHKLQSEKYEVSKAAKWAAEQTKDAVQNPERDPDPDGFPQLKESASISASAQMKLEAASVKSHLKAFLNQAVARRETMVVDALREIMVALQEGAGSKMTKRQAMNLAELVIKIRTKIMTEWHDDRTSWRNVGHNYLSQQRDISKQLEAQQVKQDRLTVELAGLRNRTLQATKMVDWSAAKFKASAKAFEDEEKRCAGVKERFRLRAAERREMLLKIHKVHQQIALKPMDAPACEGGCTSPKHGECLAKANGESSCMCNQGFYGKHCESKMCPGFNKGLFTHDMAAACHGGECNPKNGVCEECRAGTYSAQQKSCELKKCPVGSHSIPCSGHGECNAMTGVCACEKGWAGNKCEQRACAGSIAGELYAPNHHNVCTGRGACNAKTGKCQCKSPFKGNGCEFSGCLNDCTGHGKCDKRLGVCRCQGLYTGPACETKRCPGGCNNNGICDRLSGRCICNKGFIGDMCLQSTTCNAKIADWWKTFDKKGWSLCPKGSFITALYRNKCASLSCVEMARCALPCEGIDPIKQNEESTCYHASWHDSMDTQGWSRCNRGFFLSGLYRAKCDSLYCLQLAKCCSIKGGSWGTCTEVDWSKSFSAKGWSSAPTNTFLTGFYRTKEHTLDGITKAAACKHSRDDDFNPAQSRQ